jgi:lipoprotein
MRLLVIIQFLLLLSACDGCWTPIPVVSCGGSYGEDWPSIAFYQKLETIGHTDSKQRWEDAVACGATYGDNTLLSAITDKNTGNITDKLIYSFDNCMERKGYHQLTHNECGTQDPGENTGKCNL